MARTYIDIKLEITTAFIADETVKLLYGLLDGQTFEQQFSVVSMENIIFSIIAFSIFVHEQIVSKNAENSRPQNLPNFIATVLNYHDGLDLKWKDGQFQYDLTTVEDAEERKIISRCAVLESDDGELVVKVTGDDAPLTEEQAERLAFYLKKLKVPGVRIRLINKEADLIKTIIRVYVDPLMIDLDTGKQLNTSEEFYPAKDAVNEYLTNLEFNGAFVTNFFTRAIEDKNGINLVEVDLMQWQYDEYAFMDFAGWKVPESGWFKINEENITIQYLPYVLVNN